MHSYLNRIVKSSLLALALTSFVVSTPAAPQSLIEEIDAPSGSDNAVAPRLISQAAALYPSAYTQKATEPVIVSFTVDAEGKVKDPKVLSTPATQLEGPAKKAVLAWKFEAGTRLGKPAEFRLKARVTFAVNKDNIDDAPMASRRLKPVYPYEQLIKGQAGWGEVNFVVDYSGRAILTAPVDASDSAFAKSATAMLEATEFVPAKKDKHAVMASSRDREAFHPDTALDAVERYILTELRKSKPAIRDLSDLDDRPKAVSQCTAVYPRSLKTDGLTGQAEIEFVIDRDGRVLFPRIVSATHEDFGWAAATAVAQWKFNPPMRNGQRVDARMTVPVIFDAQKLASSD